MSHLIDLIKKMLEESDMTASKALKVILSKLDTSQLISLNHEVSKLIYHRTFLIDEDI